MGNNPLEILNTLIQSCGSVTDAAKAIGLSRKELCNMRNGRYAVSLENALLIEKYMREKFGIEIDLTQLLSPKTNYKLKHGHRNFSEPPIEFVSVSIHSIKPGFNKNNEIPRKLSCHLNALRPLIISEKNEIIVNSFTYDSYQQLDKKTVPAWRLYLIDLLKNNYSTKQLVDTFLTCERIAIGIAAKKYLGNRQGERSDLKLEQNFAQVKGKTDQFIASLLGLGSKENYRQSEKIQLLGSPELIQSVNEGTLKISTAARLTRFNHKHQKKILKLTKKQIFAIVYQSKKRRAA